MTPSIRNFLYAFGFSIILLVIGFFIFNNYIYNQKQGDGKMVSPYSGELTGEYVCLPHRDTSGPTTLECAFGLKTASGEYYALDFGTDTKASIQFESGKTVTLTGQVTPIEALSSDHWRIYDIVGILSIGSFSTSVNNFNDCISIGAPIMESYPRQCSYNGQTFVEEIGEEPDKSDLIVVKTPFPGQRIVSPLTITGMARGYWFFEASFPVVLYDEQGNELTTGIAQAEGDWMTEEFVPFSVVLSFTKPDTQTGELILKKDNPSGLPENDDELVVPIKFE